MSGIPDTNARAGRSGERSPGVEWRSRSPAGHRQSAPFEEARHGRRPSGPRPARHRHHRPVLADRGADAHADEQPRPRGRRASRRPRRLRRDRSRRPQLGELRRADPHAHHARAGRDDARPVRQAGRRHAHPRVGAAGADRELQPGARLGELGRVPPPRAPRPDDVRPDDRRFVDLHRHPGHPAGDVRDLRRGRGQEVQRHARGDDHPDRRTAVAWAARSRSPSP